MRSECFGAFLPFPHLHSPSPGEEAAKTKTLNLASSFLVVVGGPYFPVTKGGPLDDADHQMDNEATFQWAELPGFPVAVVTCVALAKGGKEVVKSAGEVVATWQERTPLDKAVAMVHPLAVG